MNRTCCIALVGNPNCGKTTLFNALTGSRQRVGNWPGVTVEKKTGQFVHGDQEFQLVDLPGTYSLHVGADETSIDEQIAQNFIFSGNADLVLNIVDASSLERNLSLTTQLLDALPILVIALNMTDVAHRKGLHIDPYELSNRLGCPVVPIIASRSDGLGALLDVIANMTERPRCPVRPFQFAPLIEQAIATLTDITTRRGSQQFNHHLLAVAALEKDTGALSYFSPPERQQIFATVDALEKNLGDTVDNVLVNCRYRWIDQVVNDSVHREQKQRRHLSELIDQVVLNRVLGIPLFLFVMYLMFMLTMNVGSAFVDFFDGVAAALFVDGVRAVLTAVHTPEWLIMLLADGLGSGVQLVA